jgi:hypothetical protein
MAVLLPAALNVSFFMGDTKDILRYSLVYAYVLALALADRAEEAREGSGRMPWKGLKGWQLWGLLAAAGCVLISIYYFNIDNLAYTASATAHRATEAFATRLAGRVEACPGYESGMEVVIIGSFPKNVYYSGIAVFDLTEAPKDSVLPLNKHVYYYLNDWLNIPWKEPDEETMLAVSGSDAFLAMPLYPDDGSVAVVDGRVVVKLSEQYSPKKPYEIQYEYRR